MILVVAVVVGVLGSLAWIVLPLFDPERSTEPLQTPADDLSEAKHLIYRTILDLEFDHSLGKVSDEDFIHLRRQHEAEAVSILGKMEPAAADGNVSDMVEQEIARARARLKDGR